MPRHKEKYAALNPKRAVKNRQEQLEVPYLDQLNDKEKEWLNAFLEESVITNFQHKSKKKFYKSKKAKRKLYSENNARNRCVYTKAKSMGMLSQIGENQNASLIDSMAQIPTPSEQEDYILSLMEMNNNGTIEEQDKTVSLDQLGSGATPGIVHKKLLKRLKASKRRAGLKSK
jgi:hypothetical protein